MSEEAVVKAREALIRAEENIRYLIPPWVRRQLAVIKALRDGARTLDEIKGYVGVLGATPKGILKALRELEAVGIVEKRGSEYVLTEEGESLASAIMDVLSEYENFLVKVFRGVATKDDLLDHLMTSVVSGLAIVELTRSDDLFNYALHSYISLLAVNVVHVAAEMEPRVARLVLELEDALSGQR